MEQASIFEYVEDTHYAYEKVLAHKRPIKIFEAFAGVGCQRMALKRLNVPYESVGVSEIDKYALLAYEAIHGDCRNYGDITKMTYIPDCDIFTWSFPCTDLSKAGKQKGLNGGTRSGLVYEVLRLLRVTENKPKVLIMENVVDLVQVKFAAQFYEIQKELERLGYQNYTQVLNAKDYGVAQNRERVFMVSIFGGGRYEFPLQETLTKRLKDYLEPSVDEKYYLSEKMVKFFQENTIANAEKGNGFKFQPQPGNEPAKAITTRADGRMDDNFIQEPLVNYDGRLRESKNTKWNHVSPTLQSHNYAMPNWVAIPEATIKGYALAHDGDGVYINRPEQKRGVVQKGMIQTIKTSGDDVGVVQGMRIRKLTAKECFRLMGITDEDFYKAQSVVSNSQLYKQAGNSLVVNVFKGILEGLI